MNTIANTHRQTAGHFIALGCVGFIASAPAASQEQAQQAPQQAEPTRLEGVTVTDTGVDEGYRAEVLSSPKATAAIIDTPRIVNVITQQVLQDTASFSVADALRTVPGITLGAGEGGTASADIPLIRGVDATGDVFVDGLRDIGSQSRESFALESIEVSKGPSSAFGGRGTAGGAINLVTKTARPGNFGSIQLTGGTSDLVRAVGDVNYTATDLVSVRVVGMYHDSKIAGRDRVYDDRWGVAPSITLGAGRPLSVSLDYYHYETDAMPDYGIPLTARGQLDPINISLREPADVDYDNFYGLLARDFQETNVDAVTFGATAALAPGLVLSTTTRYSEASNVYIVTNPDDSAGNVARGLVWRNTKSRGSNSDGIVSNTNLSAVFDTGSIGHSVAAGLEYSNTDTSNLGFAVNTGDRTCPPEEVAAFNCTDVFSPDPSDRWTGAIARASGNPARASGVEFSLYAFDTITLTDQLLVNGGVRWTNFSATGSGTTRGVPFAVSNSSSVWSYQGGAIYKPSETTSLYLSYANAKTPPGTTIGEGSDNLVAANALYEPQTTENWEAGFKAELFERNLLITGAIFRIDRGNITNGTDDVVSEIFDAARLQGFEVGATGRIGPVTMLVGYTYIDSELRSDPAGNDGDPTNDASSNVGNALPQSPKHNIAATLDWQVTPQLSVGGGAYGASKRFADGANLIGAEGYVRFDTHAQYDISDTIGLRVNVNNVTDERYIVKLRNPHFAVPAAGRQAIASLVIRY